MKRKTLLHDSFAQRAFSNVYSSLVPGSMDCAASLFDSDYRKQLDKALIANALRFTRISYFRLVRIAVAEMKVYIK